MHRLAYPSLALLLCGACHTQMPVAPQLVPIALDSAAASSPITFTRLIIRIPQGTEVGHHHDGFAKVQRYAHTWSAGLTAASDEFRIIALEELRRRGYNAIGGDNLLFGEDQSGKAEYQLGGTLTQLFFDTFGSLAGDYSEANLHVEWQVYDVFRREVVFSVRTNGYSKLSREGPVLHDAFRAALRNLMANREFVTTIQRRPSAQWAAQPESRTRTTVEACHVATGALPGGMEHVLAAVLVIRAGGSLGSGVVISPDGHALTAAHVAAGLKNVVARFRSGLELSADVLRIDEAQDVALIRLPGRGHPCLAVARSSEIGIGAELFAVGAPFREALAFSVTKGVVSGFRDLDGIRYIQTDASLSPGNSGGPLVTMSGKVVGIVSRKIVARGAEGLAFGVPTEVLASRLAIEWP